MLPKTGGEWGMPDEMVSALPGYGPDKEKSLKKLNRHGKARL